GALAAQGPRRPVRWPVRTRGPGSPPDRGSRDGDRGWSRGAHRARFSRAEMAGPPQYTASSHDRTGGGATPVVRVTPGPGRENRSPCPWPCHTGPGSGSGLKAAASWLGRQAHACVGSPRPLRTACTSANKRGSKIHHLAEGLYGMTTAIHALAKATLLPAACAGVLACSAAPPPDLAPLFGDVQGTFVLLDLQTGERVVHDAERARTGFIPASTFKIPNTLIALETGVASGAEFFLAWDSVAAPREDWWPDAWARDNTLRTALPASVVWFYQELARRIGAERMHEYLERFGYGNRDISGGIDQFWLTGGLRISAEEQVDFLRRFL